MSAERGLGAIGVIVALLIVAVCYFGYVGMQSTVVQQKKTVAAVDNTRVFACRTNRQTLEREIQMWSVNHPGEMVSLAALEADGAHVPACPDGGELSLAGTSVRCSVHP